MNPPLSYTYVDTPNGLSRAMETLRPATVVGLDCEADSLHSYEEKVSLIQVSGNEENFIFDPLALDDLSPLGELLTAPGIMKVLHGMEYDVVALHRDFKFRIAPAFDTALAARACGLEQCSLAHLLHRYFGLHAEKKYQKVNWSSRPLLPEWLQYAAMDTQYLPRLYEILSEEVRKKDRMDMIEEECRLAGQREWTGKSFHPDDFLRIKGASKLPEKSQRVARALAVARDRLAREQNRPPFKIMGDRDLAALATRMPETAQVLAELFPNRNHSIRRRAEYWLSAVRDGLRDQSPLPSPSKNRGTRFSNAQQTLFTSLRVWRHEQAQREGVEPALVLSTRQIGQMAEACGRDIEAWPSNPESLERFEFLRRWQIRRYGSILMDQIGRQRAATKRSSGNHIPN